MTHHVRLFLIIVCCYFYSCSSVVEHRIVALDAVISSKQVALADIIETIEIIPLEESAESKLGYIHSADYSQEYIIIKSWNGYSLYFFTHTGAFEFSIRSSGNGPLEFSEITCFAVNNKENTLVISDVPNAKVLVYSIDEHKMIFEKRLDFAPNAIFSQDTYYYTLQYDDNGNFNVYDENFARIDSGITKSLKFNTIPSRKPFSLYKGDIYLNASTSDTVYVINGTKAQAVASIGEGETSVSSVPWEEWFDFIMHDDLFTEKNRHICTYGNFTFSRDIAIIPTFNGQTILWDRKSGRTINVLPDFIANFPLVSKKRMLQSIFSHSGDYVYSMVILDEEFYDHVASLPATDHPIYNSYRNLVLEYPPERTFENPVIVKIKMKQNFIELFL